MNLGEQLKQIREEANLTIDELSEKTKIQSKYLLRLEKEEFSKLPATAYIRGFIQKWAKACDADGEKLIMQFYRENKPLHGSYSNVKLSPLTKSAFIITARHIVVIVLFIFIVGFLSYLYFTQRKLNNSPQIEILKPIEFSSIVEGNDILIKGKVENMEKLYINDKEVFVDNEGFFEYKYQLNLGLNDIVVKAKSNKGKETEAIRKVLKL